MYYRERMVPGSFTQVTSSDPPQEVVYSQGGVHGYGQAISSKNDGKRPPGYSCNPVTIFKWSTSGSSGQTKPEKAWGTDAISAKGDVAGYLARGAYIVPGQPSIPTWDDGLANEALQKSLARVSEAGLELGVMLGELRETFEGLLNPASALRKYLRDGKFYRDIGTRQAQLAWQRKQRKGARVDASAGSWMEYRNGWNPLILSIQDILKYAGSQINEICEKIRTKRGKTAKQSTSISTTGYQMPGSIMYMYDVRECIDTQYFASTAYQFLRPPTLSEEFGMSLLDLPAIGYELVTRSFVLDWFVSVGTWLEAMKSLITDRFLIHGHAVSRRITLAQTLSVLDAKLYGVVPVQIDGPLYYEIVYEILERRCVPPWSGVAMPALNSQTFGLLRTLDASALVIQGIQSLLKRRK